MSLFPVSTPGGHALLAAGKSSFVGGGSGDVFHQCSPINHTLNNNRTNPISAPIAVGATPALDQSGNGWAGVVHQYRAANNGQIFIAFAAVEVNGTTFFFGAGITYTFMWWAFG